MRGDDHRCMHIYDNRNQFPYLISHLHDAHGTRLLRWGKIAMMLKTLQHDMWKSFKVSLGILIFCSDRDQLLDWAENLVL